MANERRLIDAGKTQAAIVNIAEHLAEAGNPEMAGAVIYATEVIGNQPTVDAVEVVRCKNCKHCTTHEPSGKEKYYTCRYSLTRYVEPDDFCSHGKKWGKQPQRAYVGSTGLIVTFREET